jgi:hypothetical protein
MCESRIPFLSLDQADGLGPGKAHDLGTVLANHSLVAWSDNQEAGGIYLALEVSHDGTHWHQLAAVGLNTTHRYEAWPDLREQNYTNWAWPARYVRANILAWQENAAGSRVSATIASA